MLVHADALVAVDRGAGLLGFVAGFLLAGAEEGVPLVDVRPAVGAVVSAGWAVAGVDEAFAGDEADEGADTGGGWLPCTSTFDDPLLQAATESSRVRPAAIVPVIRMFLTTAAGQERFISGGRLMPPCAS